MISTNVLARGIDIPAVDIVINYDIPIDSDHGFKEPDYANYLHRVGRTGRFQTDGMAVTLYMDDKEGVEKSIMNKLQTYWEKEIIEIQSFQEFLNLFYNMRPHLNPGNEEQGLK
jgi:ATP-dependent RNA helicase DDX19/DBP5